jgi:hypothetical protein
MSPHDQVFLWKSQLRGEWATSGIVAECRIVEGPAPRPQETVAGPFWIERGSFRPDEPRALLSLVRVVGKGQTLVRTELKADALLSAMDILVRPRGTNFLLSENQAERLNERWTEHWMLYART